MIRSGKKFVLMVILSTVFALLTSQVFAGVSPIRKAIFSLDKADGPVLIDVDATCRGGATLVVEETEEEFKTADIDGPWHLEPTTLEPDTDYTITITCTNKAKTKTTTTKYSFWFKGSTIKAAVIKKAK